MNILGGMFGFHAKPGFQADAGAEKKVDVDFGDFKNTPTQPANTQPTTTQPGVPEPGKK
jgi:hypothetical protein